MPPYVAEMPLAGLKAAELFLLTTIRLWLAARRRADVPDWRQGFAAAGVIEDGAADFDARSSGNAPDEFASLWPSFTLCPTVSRVVSVSVPLTMP